MCNKCIIINTCTIDSTYLIGTNNMIQNGLHSNKYFFCNDFINRYRDVNQLVFKMLTFMCIIDIPSMYVDECQFIVVLTMFQLDVCLRIGLEFKTDHVWQGGLDGQRRLRFTNNDGRNLAT